MGKIDSVDSDKVLEEQELKKQEKELNECICRFNHASERGLKCGCGVPADGPVKVDAQDIIPISRRESFYVFLFNILVALASFMKKRAEKSGRKRLARKSKEKK